ncbi:Mitochondrial 50S ribosomal protein [Mycena chlorophos]|uniref:Mitochondrial 50S ribosomal protein n=1 Tax=Mycena chlorophos TaxID=658473 RepID=A0A8H6VRN8_MYCCL|nr:Mitochondrial 50S ribosomal protein [Mycena chlorophos]
MPPPITSQPFKRAQLGLFQNKMKQYGNNRKRFFFESLQSFLPVKVTTAALKTIKKAGIKGGIDNYVLQTHSETLGWKGMELRTMVQDALNKKKALEKPAEPVEIPSTRSTEAKTIPPSKFLRYTRRMAAKALGDSGLASAEDTIKYMKYQQRRLRLPQSQ